MNGRLRDEDSASFDFDAPFDRVATHSAKWAKYRGQDVLPMWIADMDFRAPPAVRQALAAYAATGDYGYGAVPPDLPNAVAAYCDRMYDWAVGPDTVSFLPALVPALQLAVRACCADGEAALSFSPIYPPFLHAARLQGRPGIELPLLPRTEGLRLDYEIDFDRLEATLGQAAPRIRLLMICHPHNPIGRLWRREELERLAELALRHDLFVLSDEVHADLILDGHTRHEPFAKLAVTSAPELAARTITINGPGKTFNTAGLGVAWTVIPDTGLRRRFHQAMARLVPEPCTAAWPVLRATLEECEPWRQALLAYLSANRDRVVDALLKMNLPHTRPVVSYLAWFDARSLGTEQQTAMARLEEHGLGLSDGKDFGLDGFARLNFALPRTGLDEGLKRLRTACAGRTPA